MQPVEPNYGFAVFFALVLIGIVVAYLVPWLNALSRGHPNSMPILIVNLFLGWTLIGWVVALAWSGMAFPAPLPVRNDPGRRRVPARDELRIIPQPDDTPIEAAERAKRMRAFHRRRGSA